jgi:hypothetical protein
MKAPKGRNKIACGIATGRETSLLIKPCKGEISYFALTGLAMKIITYSLGRCPRLLNGRPFGAFSNNL